LHLLLLLLLLVVVPLVPKIKPQSKKVGIAHLAETRFASLATTFLPISPR
jgi:hypothetical protein